MSFGSPTESIPVTSSGKVKSNCKPLLEWIQTRSTREEIDRNKDRSPDVYELPLNGHILLGRGKPIQKQVGSMRLVNFVDGHVAQYDTCKSRLVKTAMAAEMVKALEQKHDCKFLGKDVVVWIEGDDDGVREKLSTLLRARSTLAKTGLTKRIVAENAVRTDHPALERHTGGQEGQIRLRQQ